MEKLHYLKAANKLKDQYKLPIQIIDILENQDDEMLVYLKQFEKFDTRQFKADLEATLGSRVTLQMLGSREIAQVLGGLGRCQQELCCHRWLDAPLNINPQTMGNQNLKGIPSDYMGICGKLLCCLLYEEEAFKLECAVGSGMLRRLKKEPEEVQKKVAECRKEALNDVKEAKKPKKLIRRILK